MSIRPSWRKHPFVPLLGVFAFVTTVGLLLDLALVDAAGLSRWATIGISNGLTGAVAALLFYQWQQQQRRETEMMRQRVDTVAEMNHHVRNALQVIMFFAQKVQDQQSAEQLR